MITGVAVLVGVVFASWVVNVMQMAHSAGLRGKIQRMQREVDAANNLRQWVEARRIADLNVRTAMQQEINDLYAELGLQQFYNEWPTIAASPMNTSLITTSEIKFNLIQEKEEQPSK